ncbi:MAG: hypothetical protein JWM28_21 [Chitinophagaceae bacterium]|nr:hypothetical protein [Chitinophagaceae bacterium]
MKPPSLKRTYAGFLFMIFFSLFPALSFPQTTIFTYSTSWKYSNGAAMPANDAQTDTWIESDYDDASWSSGNAQFHVGESGSTDLVTLRNTTCFRKSFTITGLSSYSDFDINIVRDDGAVIYINGVQVGITNMPAGPYVFSTNASASVNGGSESSVTTLNAAASYFAEGANVIAVEVHQASSNGSDMRFQVELLGNLAPTLSLTRGPYLQSGSQTALTFRWRTNIASDSRVELGTSFGTYTLVADNAVSTTEHSVRATGLNPDTKYWYRIGSTTQALQGATDNFFTTLPTSTAARKLRFAAFGDCGKGDATYQSQSLTQYQSYLTTNNIDAPDAWLLLGDNAYNAGTDAEYTSNFFGTYGGSILKNHKLYPVPGNHDYANSATNQDTHSLNPYFSIFDLPCAGEAGGFASNKEEFYSYDIGNVHFLALDAYGEESNLRIYDTTGAQAVWVKGDLASNAFTGKWIIAYWHHPPYTMGSHNSDSEIELISMRENFIRILERYGVDMIINGHSHDYERSLLMKGYYKVNAVDPQLNESNFFNLTATTSSYQVSTSTAKYINASTCPYVTSSTASNKGTVYVVAGSTGASGSTQLGYPHNALPQSINDGGVFYFEVEGNRLDAKFIERTGAIWDQFTIMRDVNKITNYPITNGSSKILSASWPQSGSYTWNPVAAGATKTVSVTPPDNATTNYTVSDAFGCVTDQFSITASAVLPISLASYDVKLAGDKVHVNWSTSSEVNTKDFTIEKSALATGNFQLAGKVNAAGQSNSQLNYLYADFQPIAGISFYRLSQTDLDGHTRYYEVKKINNKANSFVVNQVANDHGSLTLQIKTVQQENLQLKIIDLAGKEILVKKLVVLVGTNKKTIELRPGSYVWEVTNSRGDRVTKVTIIK